MSRLQRSLIVALISWFTVTAFAQPRDFDAPWIGYDVVHYPSITSWSARLGDLNGDGKLDLCTTTWYSNNQLSVLFGDGAGRFAPPVTYPILLGSRDLELADFDEDGDLDVAVNNTGQVWEGSNFALFRNNGAGVLTFSAYWSTGAGPNGITVGDFNGDGHLDVAVANDKYIAYNNQINVMYGNGAGGFTAPQLYTVNTGTHKIAAGDLNGDGLADLAVAHKTNVVTVLLSNGSGFTTTAVLNGLPHGGIFELPAVEIADVDNDGDRDILYSAIGENDGTASAIALFRNQGNGTFAAAQAVPFPYLVNGGVDLDVADFTGDGWPDIVAATENAHDWYLVPGDGAGGFATARRYRAGEDPIACKSGDLDGDGDRDLVVIGRDSLEACVYLNPGNGAFVQPPTIDMVDPSLAPVSYSHLAVADIDHDDDLDLVVGYSANFVSKFGISVRRNNGDGTFAAAENYSQATLPSPLVMRDLNGDGFDDILWLDGARFRYRLNQGDGTFGASKAGPSGLCGGDSRAIDAWDMDGDGDRDVVVVDCINSLFVSLNNGGSFGAPIESLLTNSSSALAVADFNGDGKLDVATNSATQGYLEISLGRGNGHFDAPFTETSGRGVLAITVGDVNGDGILDIAAHYGLDGTGLSILIGRGDGSFKPEKNYPGSFSATWDNTFSVVLADVDGDHDLDALAANFGSQDVSLWRNQGDGTFADLVRYGVGQQADSLYHGDFDGDHLNDIAVLTGPALGYFYPAVVVLKGESVPWTDLGKALAGTHGLPELRADGVLATGQNASLALTNALENAAGALIVGLDAWNLPFAGGTLVPSVTLVVPITTDATGSRTITFVGPTGLIPDLRVFFQTWLFDVGAVHGMAGSNALMGITQ